MNQKAFVTPGQTAEGLTLRVYHPRTNQPIKAEGETVELTSYIRRRVRDGDLQKGSAPKADKPVNDSEPGKGSSTSAKK